MSSPRLSAVLDEQRLARAGRHRACHGCLLSGRYAIYGVDYDVHRVIRVELENGWSEGATLRVPLAQIWIDYDSHTPTIDYRHKY
jgi:hypothetical protein